MRARLASTATYESALSQKQPPSPTVASSTPATAGPTMRAVLNAAELSAMALPRSSFPTISTTNDCRAGRSNALMMPNTNARASTIHGCTTPGVTTVARTAACTQRRALGEEQQPALVHAVDHRAGPEREQHHRQELGEAEQPEHERRVR